jgi:hypothetical protein
MARTRIRTSDDNVVAPGSTLDAPLLIPPFLDNRGRLFEGELFIIANDILKVPYWSSAGRPA